MSDLVVTDKRLAAVPDYSTRISPGAGLADFQEEEIYIDLRAYLRVLLKRKWIILAVMFTITAVTAIETFTTVPLYKATVTIQIDPEMGNILPYKDVVELGGYLASEAYLKTQLEVLKSRALGSRLIKRLNLTREPAFDTTPVPGLFSRAFSAVGTFTASLFTGGNQERISVVALGKEHAESKNPIAELPDLEVSPIRGSRLVQVSYVSHEPQFAAKLVNTLTDEYIEQNFEQRYQATTRATDFLQRQLTELKIKVEKSEEDLVNYARAHNILNIDDRENIVLQKLAYLNQEMSRVQAELIAKSAQYDSIKSATIHDFPQHLRSNVIVTLESRLFELEQKLASLSSQFGPDWPEVVGVREELAQVIEQLGKEKKQAIERARIDYQVALDHHRRLSAALEEQKQQAAHLNEDSIQYNILKREVQTNTQLYDGLLQRLKEAGVAAGLKSSNIQVADPAEVPRSVYRPRILLNLALGLIVGVMFGVMLAFGLEYLDNTLKTPEEIEHLLHLPSLGIIPHDPQFCESLNQKLLVSDVQKTEGQTKEEDKGENAAPFRWSDVDYRQWETYRSLRTSLLLSHPGKPPRYILVTSALPGEGKTTTVLNLAFVLAQTAARTVVVDLDMRKPELADRFGVTQRDGGMSTYLSGNSDLASQIRQTNVPNLYLLPGGIVPPNPAELIGSARMQNALQLLSEFFRYIVIDTPPVLPLSDALVLSPSVDGVVLVVQGGKTPRDVVKKATERVLSVGGKILGVLVNNVDIRSSGYSYYYHQYYYGGYYRESRT